MLSTSIAATTTARTTGSLCSACRTQTLVMMVVAKTTIRVRALRADQALGEGLEVRHQPAAWVAVRRVQLDQHVLRRACRQQQ